MTKAMTGEELAIWRATYAAAFVAEFEERYRRVDRFDEVAEGIDAESAVTIADVAVMRLREWRRFGDTHAGISLTEGVVRSYAQKGT